MGNLNDSSEEMPMGLAFQMAMNEDAMRNFATMTEVEKRQVLEAARMAQSKNQVRSIVEDLGHMK